MLNTTHILIDINNWFGHQFCVIYTNADSRERGMYAKAFKDHSKWPVVYWQLGSIAVSYTLHSNVYTLNNDVNKSCHSNTSTLIVEMSCLKLSRMLNKKTFNRKDEKYAHLPSINTKFISHHMPHSVSAYKSKIIHFEVTRRRHQSLCPKIILPNLIMASFFISTGSYKH